MCAAIAPSSRCLAGGAIRGRSRSDSSSRRSLPPGRLLVTRVASAAAARQTTQGATGRRARSAHALSELGDADVTTPAARVQRVRQRSKPRSGGTPAEVTALPAAALTPAEFRQRANGTPFSMEELSRILASCQRARFAPLDGCPTPRTFARRSTSAAQLFGVRRGLRNALTLDQLTFRAARRPVVRRAGDGRAAWLWQWRRRRTFVAFSRRGSAAPDQSTSIHRAAAARGGGRRRVRSRSCSR